MTIKPTIFKNARTLFAAAVIACAAACGGSTAGSPELPESEYPTDEDDGYQPGGGMMPTYVPTQDGYKTIEPSE